MTALLSIVAVLPMTEAVFAPLDRLYRQSVATNAIHSGLSQTAVIIIDKKTVDALGAGKCFINYSHAQVLDRLQGAASVVLDLVIPCAGESEKVLVDAIARRGRVVLPVHILPHTLEPEIAQFPAQELQAAAAAVGQRAIVIGSDHLVQGILPYVKLPGTGAELPHIVLQAIRQAGMALPFGDVRDYIQNSVSRLGQVKQGVLSVFMPPRIDVDRYSYIDVLQGRVPDTAWKGRIVYIGDGVSDSAGTFNLSLDPGTRVRGTEASAMLTEALLDGHVLRNPSFLVKFAVNAGVLVGMLLICVLLTGWPMYAMAVIWLALFTFGELAFLLYWRYWFSPGAVIAGCCCIFGLCGWQRAHGWRNFLNDEYAVLKGKIGTGRFAAMAPAPQQDAVTFVDEQKAVAQVMQQIWGWQSGYIEMIETLPYAVFVEERGQLVLCNEKGRILLESLGIHATAPIRYPPDLANVLQEIVEAKVGGTVRSFERELNGRMRMVIVTPFMNGERYDSDASMISVVDIHDIHSAAQSDRLTLRHMAHDLRSPLATVLSLLEERLKAGVAADPSLFENIHKLVDYSLSVAQNFTQLSQAGHLDRSTYVPVSVNDLVSEAVDHAWHQALAKKIEIDAPAVSDELFICGNRHMLLRALANLLDNAIKYSGNGTVIAIGLSTMAGQVRISVRDQGIGIPEAAIPRLFEPFFQVDGGHGDPSRGVGLGLPFVMEVVRQHDGEVDVESTPDAGSCFTISFPVIVPAWPDAGENHDEMT
ncbi:MULTISPECIES: CHASE2 and HATPase_c domain-containing protein [unclassified Herbaspirillum]|uniref:CHASE2 and HATPase_c domain-containing protein n=1 Tax=unclassified Herbaspirillum TaxID=2624150 RepID=UPI0011714A85|nr:MULTISPECIES: CHASE2 and HATPase_c domain-containing protein [unclassified Herbaspirillum]MBB5390561.1 signal transduction histidine kinase/CHASE2 domain-containing sensor protein [Herbaspirillum sp. SJZ102]TQK08951.1 CHASE2 domain-containing protein [Herbaspirillum sp. SJZ130]TQK14362.1 CHASE2 domain-containing protein [Herbaspirillum sp. SJZ106]